MVRPEVFAIEREGARRERNACDVDDLRLFVSRIQSSDPPLLIAFFRAVFEFGGERPPRRVGWPRNIFSSAQNIDRVIHERVTANFRPDADLLKDFTV